jgi:chromosome partitioning protein
MPTIAFISPKGGVGKTTAATILASQLARKSPVVLIDADPNRPIARWASRGKPPALLRIISDTTQDNIIDQIETASGEVPFVIVDCEGTASLSVSYAIGAADLVIVPTQGSQLDANEAAKALTLIKNQEKQSRRRIAHGVLFTRTNAAMTPRTLKHVREEFQKHGILMFDTQLNEREAFRALFSFGLALEDLDASKVPNLDKAIDNARTFGREVVALLRESVKKEVA